MPSRGYQIRQIDFLTDHSTKLPLCGNYEYAIYHCQDTDLGKKVAKIAQRLSQKVKYLNDSNDMKQSNFVYKNYFSFKRAIAGIAFSNARFKKKGKERVFLSIFDEVVGARTSTGDAKQGQTFFCSHFVAHIFQQSIAYKAWEQMGFEKEKEYLNRLNNRFTENQNLLIKCENKLRQAKLSKNVSKINHSQLQLECFKKEHQKMRLLGTQWAKRMAQTYGDSLEEKMSHFKVDALHMSPQHLHAYVENHSSLFKHVFDVVSPSY